MNPLIDIIFQIERHDVSKSFTADDFIKFIEKYNHCKDTNCKNDFIKAISTYLNISKDFCVQTLLMPSILDDLDTEKFLSLQLEAKELIQSYQHRSRIRELRIDCLAMSHNDWVATIRTLQEQKLTRIHPSAFISAAASAKKEDYYLITAALEGTPKKRLASQRFERKEKSASGHSYYPKRRKLLGPAPVVQDSLHRESQTRAKQFGCDIKNLVQSPNGTAMQSPFGSKYRLFASLHQSNPESPKSNRSPMRLFKPITPNHRPDRKIKPTKADADRVNVQAFTASRATMEMHASGRRPRSQNTIKGGRCRDVFEQEGIVIEGKAHWSHLIMYYLGGAQNKENLVGATSQANYNMLRAYERRMGVLLHQEQTDAVDIIATAYFEKGTKIPFLIEIKLSYIVDDIRYQETHNFNPQSPGELSRKQVRALEEFAPKAILF